ncbi:hypothetical protein D3C80_1887550 [compost metagenome]
MYSICYSAVSLDLPVVPDSRIFLGDPPIRMYAAHLYNNEAGPADRPADIMHEMPVTGYAVFLFNRILAHWRHDNPVFQNQRFYFIWRKQFRHFRPLLSLSYVCWPG